MDNEGDDKEGLNKFNHSNEDVLILIKILNVFFFFKVIYNKIKLKYKKVEKSRPVLGPMFDIKDLKEAKLKQLKINKCHKILREIFFNMMFIWVLFVVCYSNRNQYSYNYKDLMKNSFISYQKVNSFFIYCFFSAKASFTRPFYQIL